ncbi:mCG141811 [Mus musculus]|nr:mCG141811 [Mus musculus]
MVLNMELKPWKACLCEHRADLQVPLSCLLRGLPSGHALLLSLAPVPLGL